MPREVSRFRAFYPDPRAKVWSRDEIKEIQNKARGVVPDEVLDDLVLLTLPPKVVSGYLND
jgi:hypothetical protein